MRTFKIITAVVCGLIASLTPAHAGLKLWQTQETHRTQVGMNFYVQAHVSRLPYVVGGDWFYQPIPGSGSTSATLPGDVDFTIHYERNGASGEFAQHLDRQGIQILMNTPYDGADWRVIAEIDPRQEKRLPKSQRWSGLLKVRFHADELPYGLLRFRTNLDPAYKQSPTWIYLFRVKQSLYEIQQIEAGAQTGRLPAYVEQEHRNRHGLNSPETRGGHVPPQHHNPDHQVPQQEPVPYAQPQGEENGSLEPIPLPSEGNDGFDPEAYERGQAVPQSYQARRPTPTRRAPQPRRSQDLQAITLVVNSTRSNPQLRWRVNGREVPEEIHFRSEGTRRVATGYFPKSATVRVAIADSNRWNISPNRGGSRYEFNPKQQPRYTERYDERDVRYVRYNRSADLD